MNAVTRFQIVSPRPNETADFLRQLFGWKIGTGEDNALGYREIDTGEKSPVSGGIWPAPPQASAFAQLVISVDDVGSVTDSAKALGATVIVAPAMLPDGDELAVLRDPQGLPFVVHTNHKARP